MGKHSQPLLYEAYLVRLWRDSQESPWRASAQSVQDGETIHFSNLPALYVFLDLCCTETSEWPSARHPGSH